LGREKTPGWGLEMLRFIRTRLERAVIARGRRDHLFEGGGYENEMVVSPAKIAEDF